MPALTVTATYKVWPIFWWSYWYETYQLIVAQAPHLKIKIRVLVILAIYHISIHNHQEGSLEAPVNTKNHHLYGHHWRANYSQKILFLFEEHKKLTVCCIIIILPLDTLFDENRCLIQNKAKLMWVQTGAILMANILSLVAWSSLKWKF